MALITIERCRLVTIRDNCIRKAVESSEPGAYKDLMATAVALDNLLEESNGGFNDAKQGNHG